MSNYKEGGISGAGIEIKLMPNIIKMAVEAAGDLVEGEVKEFQFGEKDGKIFMSLEKDVLLEPQQVSADDKVVFVSLWKK